MTTHCFVGLKVLYHQTTFWTWSVSFSHVLSSTSVPQCPQGHCVLSFTWCMAPIPLLNSILLIHPSKIQNKRYLLLKVSPIFPKVILSLSSSKLFTSRCRGLCAYLPPLSPVAQIHKNKNYILFLSMVSSFYCSAQCLHLFWCTINIWTIVE